ncbi:MAG: hypothetical protein HRT38_19300 [Alteromonadaceae bacterium]|nr:hypothetical protein [Alteromonadaceae bacterium]
MKASGLENEWSILQNQFDDYEKYSLIIKLANIGLLSAAYFTNNMNVFVLLLLLILWIQDAIWKTFQSRIEPRLLAIENFIMTGANEKAYQFNSEYQKNRPGGKGLIIEYLCQAIRPTIAFPHVLLVLMLGVELWF